MDDWWQDAYDNDGDRPFDNEDDEIDVRDYD